MGTWRLAALRLRDTPHCLDKELKRLGLPEVDFCKTRRGGQAKNSKLGTHL